MIAASDSLQIDALLHLPIGSVAVMPTSRLRAIEDALFPPVGGFQGAGGVGISTREGSGLVGDFWAIAEQAVAESGGKPVDIGQVIGRMVQTTR